MIKKKKHQSCWEDSPVSLEDVVSLLLNKQITRRCSLFQRWHHGPSACIRRVGNPHRSWLLPWDPGRPRYIHICRWVRCNTSTSTSMQSIPLLCPPLVLQIHHPLTLWDRLWIAVNVWAGPVYMMAGGVSIMLHFISSFYLWPMLSVWAVGLSGGFGVASRIVGLQLLVQRDAIALC